MECRIPSKIVQYTGVLTRKKVIHSIIRTVVLSYKILGDSPTDPNAPPILVFHDLLRSKKQWEGLGKIILNMTKRAVVAVDLRNHGDSAHANSQKYDQVVEDILAMFDKMAIHKASLIGHGVGGRACMGVALTAPSKVAGLLVVDSSPVSTPQEFLNFYPKLFAAMEKVEFKSKKVEKARKEAKKQLRGIIKDDVLMKSVLLNINAKNNNTIGWTCNLETFIKHFDHIAKFPESLKKKQYLGPTLFIGGQMSDYIIPDDLPRIREMFPRAVIKFISKTGHNVHLDDSKTFVELAIHFLKTNKL